MVDDLLEQMGENILDYIMSRSSKKVLLQVLWTGVDESAPCLYLFTDTKRYIFNCSEGLQRLFTDCRIKIGKLDTFFFTRHNWSHMGGFPGFAMTLRDAKSSTALSLTTSDSFQEKKSNDHGGRNKRKLNVKSEQLHSSLNVYGPQGIQDIFSAAHSFMKFDLSKFKLKIHEHDKLKKSEPYQDNEIVVHSFPIQGNMPLASIGGHFPYNRLIEPLLIEPLNPSLLSSPLSVCYACHLQPLPGRFLPDKAKQLGVPKGPLFGKLSKRLKVTLEDGTVISPEQVMEEDIPGMKMLLIDLPAQSYIKNLLIDKSINKYTAADHYADLVLHLSAKNVCENSEYQRWVERFPSKTKHIYFYALTQHCVTFKGQNSLQQMLHYVDRQTFPLIDQNDPESFSIDKEDTLYNFSSLNLRELTTNSFSCYDHSKCRQNINQDFIEKAKKKLTQNEELLQHPETEKNSGNKRLCDDIGSKPKAKRQLLDSSADIPQVAMDAAFPKVICLGTGAAIPSKFRNVSSTAVLLREDTAILFDCGEDTYGQLYRHYGVKVDEILKKIKIILVSHLHADHHLGLFTLIRKINRLKEDFQPEVFVVAPILFKDWLVQYGETSELLRCQFVPCQRLYNGSKLYKDVNVQCVKVEHPAMAHGFVVGYGTDKIVYSGDTLPCNALIEAGKNCTLLIHEATLEDDMIEEAMWRKHSTTKQALEVGMEMNAKHVLLTHFSQRYPKLPVINKDLEILKKTAIAFDHMEISLEAIPEFHKLIPKLSKLFELPIEEERE